MLPQNAQQQQSFIQVEGKAPLLDAARAKLISEEISAALSEVEEA